MFINFYGGIKNGELKLMWADGLTYGLILNIKLIIYLENVLGQV